MFTTLLHHFFFYFKQSLQSFEIWGEQKDTSGLSFSDLLCCILVIFLPDASTQGQSCWQKHLKEISFDNESELWRMGVEVIKTSVESVKKSWKHVSIKYNCIICHQMEY